ncbi:MAG TPA: quinone-dependent dihydroorotate dehydrogenase [Flavisolibacter sp.]|jgi:dihydroorotate dehydrogenase|nr:quinone-dependent dihydroorotate dehydrogenase [Flavisolibacter sp.]
MYAFLRRLLFFLPAETAHYFSMNLLKAACSIGFVRRQISRSFTPEKPGLEREAFGLTFRNPVGLGAGFDKNARYLRELEALGFGFVEIGTVTPRPQYGNEKPRLFRLPEDRALINRMGFNNDGVEHIAGRLKAWRKANQHLKKKDHQPLLVGGNIGKNKDTPNEEAWKDYEICFRALHPHVDFFVVNVSSPNTPGLRALQEKDALHKILTHLQALNRGFEKQKPILLKIAPDLSEEQIDDVIALATEIDLEGLVATNTTIARERLTTPVSEVQAIGAGGLSGLPVLQRSTEVLQYLIDKTGGRLPVIGSGGIFNAVQAQQKFTAGAVLIEVWTGFIYEGPFIVKRICQAIR